MAAEGIKGVEAGIMAARSGGLILFALCAAVQDFRKRSILLWLFWVFSAFGLGLMAAELFFGSQEADLRSILLRGSAFLPAAQRPAIWRSAISAILKIPFTSGSRPCLIR